MADDLTTPDKAPCKLCREPIPAEAKLCRHCHSHQDWRRHLGISSTVLALLVALVSVLSAAVPAFVGALDSPISRVSLTNPVMTNEILYLVATNTGSLPGTIQAGVLESPHLGQIELVLVSPDDAFVPPGARQIALSPRLRMSASRAQSIGRDLLGAAAPRLNGDTRPVPPIATATIMVQQSDGSIEEVRVPINHFTLLMLLGDHANRCSRLAGPPTLDNGCTNLEELIEENDHLANFIEADNGSTDSPRR